MTTTTMLRIRIDDQVKREAAKTLTEMGLSLSDAVRLLLVRVIAEKAMPFEIKAPNALTAKTLRASEKGKDLHSCANAEDMFRKLGI